MTELGIFLVLEAVDGAGKTFVQKALAEVLLKVSGSMPTTLDSCSISILSRYHDLLRAWNESKGGSPLEACSAWNAVLQEMYSHATELSTQGLPVILVKGLIGSLATLGDMELRKKVYHSFISDPFCRMPDLTVVARIEPEIAFGRIQKRGKPSRFDPESVDGVAIKQRRLIMMADQLSRRHAVIDITPFDKGGGVLSEADQKALIKEMTDKFYDKFYPELKYTNSLA